MISILAAIQKVHEIDRAHDAAIQQLREWECAQNERIERMEREIREREAKAEAAMKAAEEQHAAFMARAQSHREKMRKEQDELDAEIEALLRG